jgi:hypothetical protein
MKKQVYLGLKAIVHNNSFGIEAKVGHAFSIRSRMLKYKAPSSDSRTTLNRDNIVWASEPAEDYLRLEQEGINAMRSLAPLFKGLNIDYNLDNIRNSRCPKRFGHFGMNEELIPITKDFVFGEYKKHLDSLKNDFKEITYGFGFAKRKSFSLKRAITSLLPQ